MSWGKVGLADPIQSDPGYLGQLNRQFIEAADAAGKARTKLVRQRSGMSAWVGDASQAFVESVDDLLVDLRKMENSYKEASAAMRQFCSVVTRLGDESQAVSYKALDAQSERDYAISRMNALDPSLPDYETRRAEYVESRDYWQRQFDRHLDTRRRIAGDEDSAAAQCRQALWEAQKVGIGNRNALGRFRDNTEVWAEELERSFDDLSPFIAAIGIVGFLVSPVGLAGALISILSVVDGLNSAGKWFRFATGDKGLDADMVIDLVATGFFGSKNPVLKKIPGVEGGAAGALSEHSYQTFFKASQRALVSGDPAGASLLLRGGADYWSSMYQMAGRAAETVDLFDDVIKITASPWTHAEMYNEASEVWAKTQTDSLLLRYPRARIYSTEVEL